MIQSYPKYTTRVGEIGEQWSNLDGDRTEILDQKRRDAALVLPMVLPPEALKDGDPLPAPYQSDATFMIMSLAGQITAETYSPLEPFVAYELDPANLFDPRIPDNLKQIGRDILSIRQMMLMALWETPRGGNRRVPQRPMGFYKAHYSKALQLLVTGDVLVELTDDYRVRTWRNDHYVCQRNSTCDLLLSSTRESIDPLSLDEDTFAKTQLRRDELMDGRKPRLSLKDRMIDLYTRTEWHPWSKVWVTQQEVNGQIIVEQEDEVSPRWVVDYHCVPGENYARSFVELNRPHLASIDRLMEATVDYAAAASYIKPMIDDESFVDEDDLCGPNRVPGRCRVRDGKIQDVAMLSLTSYPNFQVVLETSKMLRESLARMSVKTSDLRPKGDRVTAYEINSIAQEALQAYGGSLAMITDGDQLPLVERTEYQARQDNILSELPDGFASPQILTGIAAMNAKAQMSRLLTYTQVAGIAPDEFQRRTDWGTFFQIARRLSRLNEPGLLKSEDQIQAEQQNAQEQTAMMQARLQGQQTAIETAGEVATLAARAATQGTA